MQDCLAVLANSERADEDRTHFVLAQFVFWLLAATDGHAKNFSLQRRLASSARDRAWARIVPMAEEVGSVLDAVEAELPANFPPRVWTAVSTGMKRHAASLCNAATEG